MHFDKHDLNRNKYMLNGKFARKGYDWWWHSFTAKNEKTGTIKPFFIEYFIINPKLSNDTPTFGQLMKNKPSYLMIKCGCWKENKKQLHKFYSIKDIMIRKTAPYEIIGPDFIASETNITGNVEVTDAHNHKEYMCDNGKMKWDLHIDKIIPFNVGYGTCPLFRTIKAFEMYWHAEGMKSKYSGTIEMDGEKYIVEPEESYGYADKNWGSNFTSPWVWLSSNNLESNITGKKLTNSVFDIGGGRPKIFFFALNRKLLSAFYYEGKCYEFNFSKFWTGTKTLFNCYETDNEVIWYVRQENKTSIIEVNVTCKKNDMLLVNYEASDGTKKHQKLWNGGNGVGNIKLYQKNKKQIILIDDFQRRILVVNMENIT